MKSWTTSGGQKIYRVLRGRSNAYLVESAGNLLLVDNGSRIQRHSLLSKLKKFDTKQKPLNLALTHSHFDHAANTACLVDTYHPPVLIHRNEADFLRQGKNPGVRGTMLFTKLLTALPLFDPIFKLFDYTPVEADILVDDGFDLNRFGIDGHLLHTPGHSPGSMSVILEDEIAIVGDTLVGLSKGSILPTYALDEKLLIKSWHRLLQSGCTLFLSGHGREGSRDIVQQQHEYYQKKFDR